MINLAENIKEIVKLEILEDLKQNVRKEMNSHLFEDLNKGIPSEIMGIISFNIELPISNKVNNFVLRDIRWKHSFIKLINI